jgi:hypothetical protein
MGAVVGFCAVIAIGACGAKIEMSDAEPGGSGGSSAGRRTIRTSPPKTASGGRSTDIPEEVPSCGSSSGGVDGQGLPSSPHGPNGIAGDNGGIAGAPFCGGCSTPTYRVLCARRVVTAQPSPGAPDYGKFGEPERACEAAQAEVSGTAGAPNGGGGGAPGAPNDGAAGAPDACETYVDPPPFYFDEGCIGEEDESHAGSCIVDGECCVITSFIYCGV